jgi:hypothetical protein
MPGLFYAQTVDEGSPPSAPIQYIRHASDHLRDSTKMVMHKSRGFLLQASAMCRGFLVSGPAPAS